MSRTFDHATKLSSKVASPRTQFGPARGLVIGLVICAAFWTGLAIVVFG